MEEINFKKINCIPSNSYLSFTLFIILTGNIIEYSNIDLHI